jgi:phage protein D
MANGEQTAFRAARPTISIADQDRPELADGLLNLIIIENTNGLYRCEALFSNWGGVDNRIDYLFFDRSLIDFGENFEVKLDNVRIFSGAIMALEANFPESAPPELNVLIEDRFQDLRMTRRTRTFEDVSDSDVINRIADDHSLTPDVQVDGPNYAVLAQVNQSDLAFLRERARTIDAELWVEGSTLYARPRRDRGSESFQLTRGNTLREFTVLADLAGQRTSVTVSGWDVARKTELAYEATEDSIRSELNGDISGAGILSSAFGERKEALVHTIPLNSGETQAEAEAFFKRGARRFITGQGIAETDSRLRVGSYVELNGIGPLFNGQYYICEIKHRFDGVDGLRTEFSVERPGLAQN